MYARDGYAVSKLWQERVTRRLSEQYHWDLTVLRPGYVWGEGGEWVYGLGIRAGPTLAVIAPQGHLPLTHVRNCADRFATMIDDERSFGQTYNVVDGHPLSTWDYASRYQAWVGTGGIRLPLPYPMGRLAAQAVSAAVGAMVRRPTRLPSLFVPASFEARFKPLVHNHAKLTRELGWHPPLSLAEALADTFGTGPSEMEPAL